MHRNLGLFSFADENPHQLAGAFFQASLFPYVIFLYFLSRPSSKTPTITNYGFQYLLVFVAMSIFAGILVKSKYDLSLADADFVHGSAESVLTISNVLIVYGLHQAIYTEKHEKPLNFSIIKMISMLYAIGILLYIILGTEYFSVDAHHPFLGGFGNIPIHDVPHIMPWTYHEEPTNALSIPTWCVHFLSVYEYLIAMSLIWKYAAATDNPTWKGLTWGMLPLHASSICAVTHHFFYNAPELLILVTMQGFLTFLGNITCMIAAYRIYKHGNLNAEIIQMEPKFKSESWVLFTKLTLMVVLSSFFVKYGEIGLDFPFHPEQKEIAHSIVFGIPLTIASSYAYSSYSQQKQQPEHDGDDLQRDYCTSERTPLRANL